MTTNSLQNAATSTQRPPKVAIYYDSLGKVIDRNPVSTFVGVKP